MARFGGLWAGFTTAELLQENRAPRASVGKDMEGWDNWEWLEPAPGDMGYWEVPPMRVVGHWDGSKGAAHPWNGQGRDVPIGSR